MTTLPQGVDTQVFCYDDFSRLTWAGSSGTPAITTAYYGGLALSVNGALSYTLSDGLGSVSASVNASSGVVSATQLYAPYGAVRYQSGALPTSYGYTHQRSDAISGLDYYNARYYDPLAGQFTSADTTLAGGLNRYAYVGGNPETRTDPTGHMYIRPTGGIGSVEPDPRTNYYTQYLQHYWQDQHAGKGKYYPGTDPEEDYKNPDGRVLARYFGLSVFGVDPQDKKTPYPDFYVSIYPGVVTTPLGDFGSVADYVGPQYRMAIELITASALKNGGNGGDAAWLRIDESGKRFGLIPRAVSKSYTQASIVAIDITALYPDGRPPDAVLQSYAEQIVYWTPGQNYNKRASRAARVLFIDKGDVVYDYHPLINGQIFGPPPPGNRPLPPAQPVIIGPLL